MPDRLKIGHACNIKGAQIGKLGKEIQIMERPPAVEPVPCSP
jgi:hypothetical protein